MSDEEGAGFVAGMEVTEAAWLPPGTLLIGSSGFLSRTLRVDPDGQWCGVTINSNEVLVLNIKRTDRTSE